MKAAEMLFPGQASKQRNARNSLNAIWNKEGIYASVNCKLEAMGGFDADGQEVPKSAPTEFHLNFSFEPQHEELLYMVNRILPQPTAMTSAERNWKTYANTHTKARASVRRLAKAEPRPGLRARLAHAVVGLAVGVAARVRRRRLVEEALGSVEAGPLEAHAAHEA